MLACGLMLVAALWKLGQSAGYIGERHVMLLVLGGMYFAVATVGWLGGWLTRGRHPWVTLLLLVGLIGVCLPRTLARLHGHRTGFREAGEWLAANTRPGDDVFDPLAWTSYHAGRLFVPRDAPRSEPEICYVVLERSKNPHPHLYYLIDLATELTRQGKIVHRLEPRPGVEIVIYQVPRPRDTTPTGKHLTYWLAVNLGPRITRGS
jgi:hypothetical protein